MDPKIKERMLKILALAKGGVGGEQENAERMLETLCAKYGVTLADLEGVKIERFWFYCNTGYEKKLLFQCLAFCGISDRQGFVWYKNAKRSRAIGLDLTTGENAQLRVAFETYMASWKQHLDDFFAAFVYKNRIFGMPGEGGEMTAKEREQYDRARAMMGSVKATSVHQRIEDKNG